MCRFFHTKARKDGKRPGQRTLCLAKFLFWLAQVGIGCVNVSEVSLAREVPYRDG